MLWCLNYPPIFHTTEAQCRQHPHSTANSCSMIRKLSSHHCYVQTIVHGFVCVRFFSGPMVRLNSELKDICWPKHPLIVLYPTRGVRHLKLCSRDRCEWPNDGSWIIVPNSLGNLTIPVNLVTAVQQLVDHTENEYARIDAVCINQQDDRQRSEQVAIMDKIFQQAIAVDIWFGMADSDVRRVGHVIQRLANFHDEEQKLSHNRTCVQGSVTPIDSAIITSEDYASTVEKVLSPNVDDAGIRHGQGNPYVCWRCGDQHQRTS